MQFENGPGGSPLPSADPAFDAVYQRFRRWASAYFVRKGFPQERAVEFTQDVFLCVYLNGKHREPDERLVPWLVTVVRNKAISEHRRRDLRSRHLSLVEVPEEMIPDLGPGPEDSTAALEGAVALHGHLEAMPEMMRTCLMLKVYQDLSLEEVADFLGLSPNTVKTHLKRAMAFLRERMAQPSHEEGATA